MPAIRSILLPTDFSMEADAAFAHGLRLAVALGAQLDIFHAEPKNDQADWRWAPSVAETLVRWGHLRRGATEADVEALGIRARRSQIVGQAADAAVLSEMSESHADLIVMASHGRSGIWRWIQPSVIAPVLRHAPVPVLVIPSGSDGFVDATTGEAGISRVLAPIDMRPHPAPGFDAALALANALPGPNRAFATLHVGAGRPETDLLLVPPGCELFHWFSNGDPVGEIARTAAEWQADLVVVVSEGRQNYLDTLRGSTVERLLDCVKRPVLVVPAEWTGKE
ncbi:MAG: universal stress protein [Deltaproteobacteria bacterium]|nr:universal stress protein [Deltaproteobacteria bacterium]